jgi:RNA-directed DNA polymerase
LIPGSAPYEEPVPTSTNATSFPQTPDFEVALEVNPVLRGWLNYFTEFYPSAVIPICRRMDRHLVRWAMRKYKRLERRQMSARACLRRVRERSPRLFAHWALRYTT